MWPINPNPVLGMCVVRSLMNQISNKITNMYFHAYVCTLAKTSNEFTDARLVGMSQHGTQLRTCMA